jgi:hypothetical protein
VNEPSKAFASRLSLADPALKEKLVAAGVQAAVGMALS